jgi:hypothetical protein
MYNIYKMREKSELKYSSQLSELKYSSQLSELNYSSQLSELKYSSQLSELKYSSQFCVVFCRSLFVLYLLAIVLSVRSRFTDSDYPSVILYIYLYFW